MERDYGWRLTFLRDPINLLWDNFKLIRKILVWTHFLRLPNLFGSWPCWSIFPEGFDENGTTARGREAVGSKSEAPTMPHYSLRTYMSVWHNNLHVLNLRSNFLNGAISTQLVQLGSLQVCKFFRDLIAFNVVHSDGSSNVKMKNIVMVVWKSICFITIKSLSGIIVYTWNIAS